MKSLEKFLTEFTTSNIGVDNIPRHTVAQEHPYPTDADVTAFVASADLLSSSIIDHIASSEVRQKIEAIYGDDWQKIVHDVVSSVIATNQPNSHTPPAYESVVADTMLALLQEDINLTLMAAGHAMGPAGAPLVATAAAGIIGSGAAMLHGPVSNAISNAKYHLSGQARKDSLNNAHRLGYRMAKDNLKRGTKSSIHPFANGPKHLQGAFDKGVMDAAGGVPYKPMHESFGDDTDADLNEGTDNMFTKEAERHRYERANMAWKVFHAMSAIKEGRNPINISTGHRGIAMQFLRPTILDNPDNHPGIEEANKTAIAHRAAVDAMTTMEQRAYYLHQNHPEMPISDRVHTMYGGVDLPHDKIYPIFLKKAMRKVENTKLGRSPYDQRLAYAEHQAELQKKADSDAELGQKMVAGGHLTVEGTVIQFPGGQPIVQTSNKYMRVYQHDRIPMRENSRFKDFLANELPRVDSTARVTNQGSVLFPRYAIRASHAGHEAIKEHLDFMEDVRKGKIKIKY